MATQSLYRRYRPQRFDELKGQEHVVRALRTAVAEGRAGQAYLFSGPRGTGKTSTARILAKVLNCEDPQNGEPCGECESCRAVEQGTSYDVHELDAASNRGVDDVRQLIEKASLGTPGRHKVYILDEVHMLTPPAEAALLKTLEEPPSHVVFVLATTDPQKVKDTIRSRTQHLQFHLLPADTLREHVRWVVDDAGLEVDDDAVGEVLAVGGGSARDTLSALELVAAGGGGAASHVALDGVVEAMEQRDPGAALAVVAQAVAHGRDPRMITEQLVGHLRDRFLALMAPDLVALPADQVERVTEQATAIGAPALVRGIERLGTILVEMRQAPDPRVLLDVAVVQLTSDEAESGVGALEARLRRLEQRVADAPSVAASVTAQPAAPTVPATPAATATSGDGATPARAKLGSRARKEAAPATAPTPTPEPVPAATSEPAAAPEPVSEPAADVTSQTWDEVKPQLKGRTRAMFSAGRFLGAGDGAVTLGFPNRPHVDKCLQARDEVASVFAAVVGRPVRVELVVDAGEDDAPVEAAPGAATGRSDRTGVSDVSEASDRTDRNDRADEIDEIDLDDLVDAPPEAHKSGLDRLAEAFPGSELVDESN